MVHSYAPTKFSVISPDCRHLAMAFALFLPGLASGQGLELLPTQQHGGLDAEVWTAGIIAQHDSSPSFDTGVWLSGARFGRVLTASHGPGWFRGALEWNFGLGPAFVFSPKQTASGVELTPLIFRWNFLRERRTVPYFEMGAGVMLTNSNVPPGDTSSVNISARAGFGWQIFTRPRRSFDAGVYAWHLSNAWTGRSNPSVNGIQLMIGYHWFIDRGQQTPVRAPAPVSNSVAGSQPLPAPGQEQKVIAAPAITGTPGMFTVETAEVLPKGEVAASAYMNRSSLTPGSVNILTGGLTLSGGLTQKITVFARFDPYVHAHVAEPSQLSLNFPAGCPHDVYQAPIYCAVPTPPNPNPAHPLPSQSSWKGPAAAYVPGYPFLAQSTSGYGPLDLGFKVNFWSEAREDPLSVSLRTDFYIPTASAATELANKGPQSGAFDYSFTLGLSKTFRKRLVAATNVTYAVVGHPKANDVILLTPGDQIIFGQGFIFPIRRSLEFMTEFTGTFYQEGRAFGLIGLDTQNTSHGPSDPVDGVWGVRWHLRDGTAFDVGYRYMLNLHQVKDRSGFILQISNLFRKPKPG